MARPTELPKPGSEDVLYLIDLSGYVFRAYHALTPLNGPTGEPTHATYGTLNMLAKLIREKKPTYLAVALEGGRGHRAELDVRYKATRPAPPPDLQRQLERTKEIVDAYRIHSLFAEGFEADDVIAAIVMKAKADGLRVVIASADKDLLQLVDDKCVMWDAMRDRVYGPPEVVAKFGVGPEKVRDLLALVGDSSDNIPGVKGIGVKTAAELLVKYGSLDGIYAHIDELTKPKMKQSLIDDQAEARLSQILVTLREDAPVVFDKRVLRYEGGDSERLRELFAELGFTRFLEALPRSQKVAPVDVHVEVETLLDEAALERFITKVRETKSLALQLFTSTEDATRTDVIGISMSPKPGKAAYVPLSHRYLGAPKQLTMQAVATALKPILEDVGIAKLGHDLKKVDVILRRFGVMMEGLAYDAMLASYLLDPEVPNDLPSVVDRDVGLKLKPIEAILPKTKGKTKPILDDVIVEEASAWGAPYGDAIARAFEVHMARMKEAGVLGIFGDIELPLSRVLADLEERGVLVDESVLGPIGAKMSAELQRLEAEAREACGHPELNLGSPKQLETILFDELGLKAVKKTKTGRSTDAEALEAIEGAHPLPHLVLEHRAIAKLKGTYVDALPRLIHADTGRIHGHWRQAVAATGRISSEEPNLQNIPIRTELGREIRKAFVAPKGSVFLSADYSQIELRVLAHLSKDPVLLDAFRNGQDIHTRTAMEIFGVKEADVTVEMRRRSKTVNFGVVYGMGETALAKRLGIPRSEAAEFIESYFERYRGVADFMHRVMDEARRTERVRTLLGRIRILPDLRNSDRMKRSQAERIAQNTPIQGTAADILKLAMIKLRQPVVPGARMVLTVHDELTFEVPHALAEEAKSKLKPIMQDVVALDVPLVVEVGFGTSWAEAH